MDSLAIDISRNMPIPFFALSKSTEMDI